MSNPVRDWFQTKIEIEHGSLGTVIEWCKRNCSDEWCFSDLPFSLEGNYKFYFNSEKDYVNFLVWKK